MHIVVNGEPHDLPETASIALLLTRLQLQEQRLAIELNGEIVPRAEWSARGLQPADRIEIVRAIGGG